MAKKKAAKPVKKRSRKAKKPQLSEYIPLIVIGVVVIAVAAFFLLTPSTPIAEGADPEIAAFAQCLTDKGLVMYGSVYCSICAKERALFGPAFDYIDEIECHPRAENSQTELCLERNIPKTPTWFVEKDGEIKGPLVGYQTFETLAEFTGCPAPAV